VIRRSAFFVAFLLFATLELRGAKEFFDHYDAGLKAASAEKWSEVVQHMSAALSMKPGEEPKARTVGVQFIPYYPYYYRGVAYFNLGEFQKAAADLQKAKGVGRVNLGSLESFQTKVETRLAQATQPAQQQPAQQQPPPNQQPSLPSVPVATVDPNLAPARQRASQAVAAAQTAMGQAQGRNAQDLASNQFQSAQAFLVDARTKQASADTASDFTTVAQIADKAKRTFEVALEAAQMTAANQRAVPGTAVAETIAPIQERVRRALGQYFSGEYGPAARSLETLTKAELSSSHMAFAFLGASYYNRYVLSGKTDKNSLTQANNAFKKAKNIRRDMQLSTRYFSPRVQAHFRSVAR